MSRIITKTLVCLYGIENDDHVLEGGISVCKAFGAQLVIGTTEEGKRNDAQIIESKLVGLSIPTEQVTLPNESVKAVAKMVDDIGADLVVTASTKHTQHLVDALEVPVLSILKGFGKGLVKNILMPIHDDPGTRQKIPIATEVAKTFGANINILVVAHDDKEEITKLKTYAYQAEKYILDKGGRCTYQIEIGKKVAEETVRVAVESGADMVIIMNDRGGGGWFGKPLSDQIMSHCDVPVLVVEPKDTTISYAQL